MPESPVELGGAPERDRARRGKHPSRVVSVGRRLPRTQARSRRARRWEGGPAAAAEIALLLIGAVIQSFRMLEPSCSCRGCKPTAPSPGALVGSLVETEWVHLVYNAAVLANLGLILYLPVPAPAGLARDGLGDRLVIAVGLLQGYHVVAHAVKVLHETTGAKGEPGLLGSEINLALLQFGLNAAVYAGFAETVAAY